MGFSLGTLFKRFFSSGLGNSIAIDLGTANVLFYLPGEGVVLNAEGSGGSARVHVNFETEGAKWLMLAYANLQPL